MTADIDHTSRLHSWKDVGSSIYEGLEIMQRSSPSPRKSITRLLEPSLDSLDEDVFQKGNYESHMEKEIVEQAESIKQTMEGRVDFENFEINLKGIENFTDEIIRCRRIIVVGSASSYHVAIATRPAIEELLEVPVFVELASDFLDREVSIFRDDVCIFISQSGETASVLSACQYCKKHDALVMGITNDENSRLSVETHFGINANAGIEIGVTSTKTYTSQFLALVMFALKMASDKRSKRGRVKEVIREIQKLPDHITNVLKLSKELKEFAKTLVHSKRLLVMGRGYQQATMMEGSFKFKEIVNIHSEGIHSGELKHGPLALIDDEIPIIMIILRDKIYEKCINAIEQVKARGGKPIVVCEESDEDTKKMAYKAIGIPKTVDCLAGILAIIPFQLLSMHLALLLGKSVDEPKNLQKTVRDSC